MPDKDAPSDVDKLFTEIQKLPAPIASREWLYTHMKGKGYSEGLRLWMGSNLVPDGQGKYKWGFNIEGASGQLLKAMAQVCRAQTSSCSQCTHQHDLVQGHPVLAGTKATS